MSHSKVFHRVVVEIRVQHLLDLFLQELGAYFYTKAITIQYKATESSCFYKAFLNVKLFFWALKCTWALKFETCFVSENKDLLQNACCLCMRVAGLTGNSTFCIKQDFKIHVFKCIRITT